MRNPPAVLQFQVRVPTAQLGSKAKQSRSASSGCDAQYNLLALMRRASKHLVGNAGLL